MDTFLAAFPGCIFTFVYSFHMLPFNVQVHTTGLGASQYVAYIFGGSHLLTPLCAFPFFLQTFLPSLPVLFCISFLLLRYEWALGPSYTAS